MGTIIKFTSTFQIRIFFRTFTIITDLRITGFYTSYSKQLKTTVRIVPICQGRHIQQIIQATATHLYFRIIYFRWQIPHVHPYPESVNRSNPFSHKKTSGHTQSVLGLLTRKQTIRTYTGREEEMFIKLIALKLLIRWSFLQHILQCTIILCL